MVYMPTWLGYIDGIHVTILMAYMDPMGYTEIEWEHESYNVGPPR